jgi:ABC-type sugar transport system permease subunit
VLISPALGAIVVFFFLPVLAALALSVTDFDIYALADLANLRIVGGRNYTRLLADPTWRQHRLISEANVATEAGENWVSDQAINARATSDDANGVYSRRSTGTSGFEAVAFWINTGSSDAVVHTTNLVTLRPEVKFTVGSRTRVAHAAAPQSVAAGTVMSFVDTAPGQLWLKVDAATAPGGSETHLQIYVQEVQQ